MAEHGTTADGRGWVRWTDEAGMPRQTNAANERDIIVEREAADKAAKAKRGRTEWKEFDSVA